MQNHGAAVTIDNDLIIGLDQRQQLVQANNSRYF